MPKILLGKQFENVRLGLFIKEIRAQMRKVIQRNILALQTDGILRLDYQNIKIRKWFYQKNNSRVFYRLNTNAIITSVLWIKTIILVLQPYSKKVLSKMW